MFEVQPELQADGGDPLIRPTKVDKRIKTYLHKGYWNRRNIKQSELCSDFPEAVETFTNVMFRNPGNTSSNNSSD